MFERVYFFIATS